MVLAMMGDARSSILGLPVSVVMLLVGIGLIAAGFLWMRHTLEPGPLVRGEGRWRYRDRRRVERFRAAIHSLIVWPRSRTSGWWATRLEFGLAGVMLAIATVGLQYALSLGGLRGPSMLEILATSGTGYAGILFGIWWMRRIYLAPLETDPEVGWRYRDR